MSDDLDPGLVAALLGDTSNGDGHDDDAEAFEALVRDADAAPDGPNLPDKFWRARRRLEHVRKAAWSRGRSPDAVLGALLCRVALLIPPTHYLPALVGDTATLDLVVAVVAPSGGGKSTAARIARQLVPINRTDIVDGMPVGSGEGIIDAYLGNVTDATDAHGNKYKHRPQVRTAVGFVVDEGEVLAELGDRRGSTLLQTVRSAWSGSTLGQANASADRYRHLPAGSYRFAMHVAMQPTVAGRLLADDAGGTPQRILWLPGTDPNIPDDAPHWPGPLLWTPPVTVTSGVEVNVDDQIAAEIRRRSLDRARGNYVDTDTLDAHGDLQRLKVAALLGLLDDRASVTDDDWEYAGMVMTTSRRTRAIVAETARQAAVRQERAHIDRQVRAADAMATNAERKALNSAARSVANAVHKSTEPTSRRTVSQAIGGKYRQLVSVDDAIGEAIDRGWIAADGDHYRPGESRPT